MLHKSDAISGLSNLCAINDGIHSVGSKCKQTWDTFRSQIFYGMYIEFETGDDSQYLDCVTNRRCNW